jgi:hypothetical protein
MYIPVTGASGFTTLWLDLHSHSTMEIASSPSPHRQEAIVPPLSGTAETSVTIINPHRSAHPSTISTSIENSRTQLPSSNKSIFPSSIVTTVTETEASTPAARLSSITSATIHNTISTSPATPPSATPLISAPTTKTEIILPTSTHAASAFEADGRRIGIITGAFVGSIIGAIVLGLLIYWLYACYRGVNVCNCFGSCCERRDNGHQNNAAQSPTMLYPMSGIGAAPRMDNIPRPPTRPPRVVEDRASRLQRKVAPICTRRTVGNMPAT